MMHGKCAWRTALAAETMASARYLEDNRPLTVSGHTDEGLTGTQSGRTIKTGWQPRDIRAL